VLVGRDLCHVDVGYGDRQGAASLSQEETKHKEIPIPAEQAKKSDNVDDGCHEDDCLPAPSVSQPLHE
jgi:hypothetical protein